ncbi:DUF7350 domain-containing protein [Natronorubrum thiooxidans]|uniref:DUF7350 domain-containing protein n=1 Tax=Natronorubrum thiooxidans TaxID=308853 RepID=A0A1N7E5W1_9EURY|nr:hypothetical protein [Natronorubrum thiooxidans]SIR83533.1 hypothetical protein SAMN05421752_103239 [Natronorubrum thiooxidans]
MHDHDLDRRTFVQRTGATTGILALAGCLGTDGDDEDEDRDDPDNGDDAEMPRFPEIDDPPAAVYRPTHRESMRMLEPITAGEYTLAPMLSYPHPFWLITGGTGEDDVERVDPEQGRGVHLMITLWDDDTGIVLPVDTSATIRIFQDGDQIGSPQSPWPMISQEMGFHFGDNVPLEDDGTYTVEVELPPIPTHTTGDLEGRFTDSETATFEFEYDQAFRDQVVGGVEYLDESEWGERGALEPMDHGRDDGQHGDDHDDDGHHHDNGHVPDSALPSAEAYPGTRLEPTDGVDTDLPRSGDAAVLVTLLEAGSRLADGDEQYLLVSPRTPYNRVPLADMAMSVTVDREGEPVGDADGVALEQTIDSEYDLHYGASLPALQPGDSVTVTIESPPQVARHQGYETAFLEMPSLEFTVPEESDA